MHLRVELSNVEDQKVNKVLSTVPGMTQHEQVETLKRFKQGDVKLLVTTSVGEEGIDIAECNLTIRYNHVGNEVTTVQTRGTKINLHTCVCVWLLI